MRAVLAAGVRTGGGGVTHRDRLTHALSVAALCIGILAPVGVLLLIGLGIEEQIIDWIMEVL